VTSHSRSVPPRPLRAGALALAALALTTLAPPARAQTLEPTDTRPTELLPVRLEGSQSIDPYLAGFTPAAGNGYYSVWFEASFNPRGPIVFLGQRFDGFDLPVGEERSIGYGAAPDAFPSRLQAHRNGGPVLALWSDRNALPTARGRFLNARGAPVSPVFPLGSPTSGDFWGCVPRA
jgi:hypothetical protein